MGAVGHGNIRLEEMGKCGGRHAAKEPVQPSKQRRANRSGGHEKEREMRKGKRQAALTHGLSREKRGVERAFTQVLT
jgi:hypothetical protein